MKKYILFWIFIGLSMVTRAQTLSVTDAETGLPVELATLLCERPGVFAITNSKGQADLLAFKNAMQIEISSINYQTYTGSFADLEQSAFSIQLVPSGIDLDLIVVSASRWNEKSARVASQITTLSPDAIALRNPQTAADLLNVSGKVFIQKSQQGGGSPMIRGFATNRLLYAVDGIRMNTAIFRGGNIQNLISLDPFAIGHAEVLFGPGSVIYGSDAIGGVMSFQTLTPGFSLDPDALLSGKAVTRYSSANEEKTVHFDVQIGWKKWALAASLSSNDFGDLRMGSFGPEEYLRPFFVQRMDGRDVVVMNDDPKLQRPSGYSQIHAMQKIRYSPNANWDLQYGIHYSETSDYGRYDRHIRYKNGAPRYGEWSYGPQKWMMNQLSAGHHASNLLYDQLSIRMAHQYFEESRISRDIDQSNREIRLEEVGAWSVNVDLTKWLGERHKLYYGAEYVRDDVSSTGTSENILSGTRVAGPSRYPQANWASLGIYLSEQFQLNKQIHLQAGLRYNQFLLDAVFDTSFYSFPFTTAKLNQGSLTGSLGFSYRPTDEWMIRINGATAFRSPNVDDMGKVFDSEPGAVTVPNPALEAEYAWNADLGVARKISDWGKIDLSVYYTLLENAMVRRNFTLDGMDSILYDGTLSQVQAIQNAAWAWIYGIQAGIEILLPGGFKLSSDINFQQGEEELDDGTTSPLRHAPPWFGVTRLSYQVRQVKLEWYAEYQGERSFADMPAEEKGKPEIYAVDINGNPYSPGWYTLNFKVMYPFATHFTLSAGMENITDQRYRPYSSGIAAAGRNVVFSVRYQF